MDLEERIRKIEHVLYGEGAADGLLTILSVQQEQMSTLMKQMEELKNSHLQLAKEVDRLTMRMGTLIAFGTALGFIVGYLMHP
ncbi:MAG: hypothetical protein QW750_06200 [Zestosphaera sp.]